MICKKCGKHYDSTWKICLNCNEQLVDDSSHAFGPKGQADKIMSLTYYTVVANRLIVLGINGSAGQKNRASDQIEKFASTFEVVGADVEAVAKK